MGFFENLQVNDPAAEAELAKKKKEEFEGFEEATADKVVRLSEAADEQERKHKPRPEEVTLRPEDSADRRLAA